MDAALLAERSCVVIANAHNPSILNHDWLVRNDVLPDSNAWEWAEPPITTWPLSRIRYQNNVELHLESERLIVRADQLEASGSLAAGDAIRDIATKYVKTLPHVPYVAVGSNFKALVERENPRRTLVEQFRGSGSWAEGVQDVSVTLVYTPDGYRRSMRISADTAEKVTDDVASKTDVIVVSGNYHRWTGSVDGVIEAIKSHATDCDDFLRFASELAEDIDG